jgi:hypothetical protein
MKERMLKALPVALFAVCTLSLLTVGVALSEGTWVDEITNSMAFYKTNYPTSNWEPYQQKLTLVRDAVGRGDQRTVKVEMSKFFRMLQRRDHGINDVAADELYNFSVMVTPVQEYGISVPTATPAQ